MFSENHTSGHRSWKNFVESHKGKFNDSQYCDPGCICSSDYPLHARTVVNSCAYFFMRIMKMPVGM